MQDVSFFLQISDISSIHHCLRRRNMVMLIINNSFITSEKLQLEIENNDNLWEKMNRDRKNRIFFLSQNKFRCNKKFAAYLYAALCNKQLEKNLIVYKIFQHVLFYYYKLLNKYHFCIINNNYSPHLLILNCQKSLLTVTSSYNTLKVFCCVGYVGQDR